MLFSVHTGDLKHRYNGDFCVFVTLPLCRYVASVYQALENRVNIKDKQIMAHTNRHVEGTISVLCTVLPVDNFYECR